jgi:hypothetical protein
MAYYKNWTFIEKMSTPDFDQEHAPGTPAPFPGIYRCAGCGTEVPSFRQQPLPESTHHQHERKQGDIAWRMIVFADPK